MRMIFNTVYYCILLSSSKTYL